MASVFVEGIQVSRWLSSALFDMRAVFYGKCEWAFEQVVMDLSGPDVLVQWWFQCEKCWAENLWRGVRDGRPMIHRA